jgi:integrase
MIPLTLDQAVQFTNELRRTWSDTFQPFNRRRNAVFFGLLLHGLRRIEATRIRRNQLNADANLLRFQSAKGGTMRTIRVSNDWKQAALGIHREQQLRLSRPLQLLITTNTGKPLDEKFCNEALGDLTKRLFGVRLSTHVMRHTAAVICWQQTHDMIAVQHLLGHRNMITTQRYLLSIKPPDSKNAIDWSLEIKPPLQLFNPGEKTA